MGVGKTAVKPSANRLPPGFTLLEIMVAIFIFSIVVTTIFSSYRTVLVSADAVEKVSTDIEAGKNCMDRMMLDLISTHVSLPPAYRKPDLDDPPDPFRFVGGLQDESGERFSRLRFASRAHLPQRNADRRGVAEIVYYIQPVGEDRFILRRADRLHPFVDEFEEKETDPVLCENVRRLRLEYVDAEGEAFERWDSDSDDFGFATPRVVHIYLELGDRSQLTTFTSNVLLPVQREEMD